jgi:hypothetical protein
MVIVLSPRDLRRWLKLATQEILDRVSELADEPQEQLLKGIEEKLQEQLKKHQARPARRVR